MSESSNVTLSAGQGRSFQFRASARSLTPRLLSGLGLALGVFVGCVLLYSGIQHLGNTFSLLASVLQYQIVPPWLARMVAVGLPFVQIVIGVSLIGQAWVKPGLLAACGLFALFALAQCLALGRGLEIPCGCFGTTRYEPVGAWTMARTLGLLALAALTLAISMRKGEQP